MTKNTKDILNLIQTSDKHLTADEIFHQIKKINSTISLSTTYRNLGLLVEEGLIRKYDIGESHLVYDKRMYDHAHAVDEKGNVVDIIDESISSYLAKYVDGEILSYDVVIHYKKR